MKLKQYFWYGLLLILGVSYLTWKANWWIDDLALKKSGVDELVMLVKQPALKNAEILSFFGTHEGEERDDFVKRYVFYSQNSIEFPYMNHHTKLSKSHRIISESFTTPDRSTLKKSMIEESTGLNIGVVRNLEDYDLDVFNENGNYQIKISVLETEKGFYVMTESIH